MTERPVLRIINAGISQFQDLGRFGHERNGLSVNGAADQLSARAANILVGNPQSAPHLEIMASSFAAVVENAALIAVAGAECEITVDGASVPNHSPLAVRKGQTVRLSAPSRGLRVSLAIRGFIQTPVFAGSCSPDSVVGFKSRIVGGQTISVDSDYVDFVHPFFVLPLFRFVVPRRQLPDVWPIGITPGTDFSDLAGGPGALSGTYSVTPQADAIGLRLAGPVLQRTTTSELVSRGVPVGGVELVPNGGLIILHRGRYVTAGYPIIAVVTRTSLSVLGQAAPGQPLKFVWTTTDEAVRQHRQELQVLEDLERNVHGAFQAAGLGVLPREVG
ncbi:biotin-dependent carboxyltransferase family protein [Arthrobacter sp. MW3 TE3886]|uniref:5-oxoprolinase subunit C family protein n=1 Tax=Arthrobacter sp. MW3 TE3886 TaxID=3156254 RepID=UPI00351512A4